MDYESATAEEVAAHFDTISRQRIQQLIQKYKDRERWHIVAKMQQAKQILKAIKYLRKNSCTLEETKKCNGIWSGLLRRVNSKAAYLDCSIEFESESAFRAWAIKQVGFHEEGFELDKDILIKGNRVYSPDTCVFLPVEINSFFSGCYRSKTRGKYPLGVSFNKGSGSFVAQMNKEAGSLDKYLGSFKTVEEAFACYKAAKEAKIKRLAEKWRDKIDPRAYEALMARTVEWDD